MFLGIVRILVGDPLFSLNNHALSSHWCWALLQLMCAHGMGHMTQGLPGHSF